MKRNIKNILLVFLLIIPFIIKADVTYSNAINYTNTYIDAFVGYDKYLIFPSKEWYYYNTIVPNSGPTFSRGGFLSRQEYLITNYNNKSYLSPGVQYWTLTPGSSSSKKYVIDYLDKEIDTSLTSGVRITEFINPRTGVQGSGTKSDPWFFMPVYKVSLATSDYKKGQIDTSINGDGDCSKVVTSLSLNVFDSYENDEEENNEGVKVKICPDGKYEFFKTNCANNIVLTDQENVLEISKVDKNMSCEVDFVLKVYKITLNTNGGSAISTKELYLAPGKYWFKEKADRVSETSISKISQVPTKTGYTFVGFYTTTNGGKQIIDANGNIVNKDAYKADGTMYANWKAKTYTVTFNKQSGTGGTTSVIATYGSAMPAITVPTRTGYTFGGYYTSTGGSGTQYYTASGTSARTMGIAGNITLYAKWTANKYTVRLDANGATSSGTISVSATYGIAMPAITKPSKSYKVTFNGNGGSAGSSSLTSTYTFGGYYSGSTQYYTASGASARVWDKTSETTLTASWSGGAITLPSATRSAYTFNGWYTATSGGTKIGNAGASYTPTSATTLYAQWKPKDITPPTCTTSGTSTSWTTGSRTITYGCSDASGCKSGKSGGTRTFYGTTKTGTIPAYTIEDIYGNVTNCPSKTVNVYVATSITGKVRDCYKNVTTQQCTSTSTPGCSSHARCGYCSGYFVDNWIGCCANWGWQYAHSGLCWRDTCTPKTTTTWKYGVTTCPSGYTQYSTYCPSGYTQIDSTRCYK